MNLLLLLDMVAAGRGDEVAVQAGDDRLTAAELLAAAWAGAELAAGASALAYVGTNGLAFPIGLFAAAAAGVPFVPLNYRLSDEQLHDLLAPLGDTLVVAEGEVGAALAARGHRVLDAAAFVATARAGGEVGEVPADGEGPAVLLYTSGTTAAPKAAVLRHRHLTSYVIGTVEFAGAGPDEAVLVSVPPYHVAGLANLLSNLYLGRRIVYLTQFDAAAWVAAVRREGITNAMVVPTMLARICDVLDADGAGLPSLRALSYGGARTPATVLQRVMTLLPDVDLTNAYGLTETSSTIAVLGPDDHRAARDGDPAATARLSSAGRVLPTVEVEVRGGLGEPLPGRRARRDLGAGRAGVGRVRRPGGAARRRGLVPDAGPRLARRRRVPLHRGPQRRHDHPGRREHRPGRDRGGAAAAPRHRPVRGGRRPRRRVGPAHRGGGGGPAGGDASMPPTSRRSPAGRCGARRPPRSSPSSSRCPSPRPASSSAGSCRPTSSPRADRTAGRRGAFPAAWCYRCDPIVSSRARSFQSEDHRGGRRWTSTTWCWSASTTTWSSHRTCSRGDCRRSTPTWRRSSSPATTARTPGCTRARRSPTSPSTPWPAGRRRSTAWSRPPSPSCGPVATTSTSG